MSTPVQAPAPGSAVAAPEPVARRRGRTGVGEPRGHAWVYFVLTIGLVRGQHDP